MKQTFVIQPGQHPSRDRALHAVMHAPAGSAIVIKDDPSRTLEQNSALWPILEAFSNQLQWPVNGQMVKMSADEWKDVLTASFRKEKVRMAMGIDGGMVMLGMRTSTMGKKEFSEFLEFMHYVAAERGVVVYDEVAA